MQRASISSLTATDPEKQLLSYGITQRNDRSEVGERGGRASEAEVHLSHAEILAALFTGLQKTGQCESPQLSFFSDHLGQGR